MTSALHTFLLRTLAADPGARTLQLAGLIRFVFVLAQGIILVKAGVPLILIGQVELVFFVAHFFMYFWQNGGNNAMLSWSGRSNAGLSATVLAGMHVCAFAGMLLFVAAVMWIPVPQYALLAEDPIMLAAYVFFSIPATALPWVWLRAKRFKHILWYSIISYGAQLAVVTVPLIAGFGIEVMLTALAVFAIARWMYVLAAGDWWKEGHTSRIAMFGFLAFAAPLIIHALNSGVMDYVDGWIVSVFFGEEEFARYRYGARELPLTALLLGGLTSGLIHRYRSNGKVDTPSLRAESLRIMHLLFPLTSALVLVSPFLYRLVYSEEFVVSARIFNIYAFTLVSRVVLNHVIVYVMQRPWVLTWSTLAEVVINVILSILLIRWLGLYGIPLATAIAYLLHRIYLGLYVYRMWDVHIARYVPLKTYAGYVILMLLCFYLSEILWF